jgi:hypothetical protein
VNSKRKRTQEFAPGIAKILGSLRSAALTRNDGPTNGTLTKKLMSFDPRLQPSELVDSRPDRKTPAPSYDWRDFATSLRVWRKADVR